VLTKQIQEEMLERQKQKNIIQKYENLSIQQKEFLKNNEKEYKLKDKEHFNKLIEENENKEREKNRKYCDFYEKFKTKLDDRMKIHTELVKNPMERRSLELEKIIQKRENEYNEKVKQKEKLLNEWRKSVIFFSIFMYRILKK